MLQTPVAKVFYTGSPSFQALSKLLTLSGTTHPAAQAVSPLIWKAYTRAVVERPDARQENNGVLNGGRSSLNAPALVRKEAGTNMIVLF